MMETEMQNDLDGAEKIPEGYSGWRVEPVDPETTFTVDEESSYDVQIGVRGVRRSAEPASPAAEPASPAAEPVSHAAEPVSAEAEATAPAADASVEAPLDEADTLPPVPEGVVKTEGEAEAATAESAEYGFEGRPPVLHFLGSTMGPEVDYISPEEGLATFDEVMIELVAAALEGHAGSAEPLTGEGVAQIFCRGDTDDPRVTFLLLLLAQNEPITGELVVAALRAQGKGDLVDGEILAREELERAGDISVEQLSAAGSFVAMPREEASQGAVP